MFARPRTLRGKLKALAFGFVACCTVVDATPSLAQELLEDSYLVDVRAGDGFSSLIRSFRYGGYELSDGTPVNLSDWYESNWRDLHVTMMTQVRKNFGLLWGLGTGERGEKYTIDPSLRLGFIWRTALDEGTVLSFSATTLIGGRLRERPCIADYGAIGGIQAVNCRLAATFLAPEETLNYLANESPADRIVLKIGWVYSF